MSCIDRQINRPADTARDTFREYLAAEIISLRSRPSWHDVAPCTSAESIWRFMTAHRYVAGQTTKHCCLSKRLKLPARPHPAMAPCTDDICRRASETNEAKRRDIHESHPAQDTLTWTCYV